MSNAGHIGLFCIDPKSMCMLKNGWQKIDI